MPNQAALSPACAGARGEAAYAEPGSGPRNPPALLPLTSVPVPQPGQGQGRPPSGTWARPGAVGLPGSLFESDGWSSTHVRQGAGWRPSNHVGLTYFWKEMADQIPQGCQAPGSPRPLLGGALGRAKRWGPSGTCPQPPTPYHCHAQLPGGGTHSAKPNKETLEHG